jgi:hypothetical protein
MVGSPKHFCDNLIHLWNGQRHRSVADRTVDEIEQWKPGLPVFGQLTPFPATPLYERLEKSGRLQRPLHWLDFAPFVMAHDPLKMTIDDAKAETFRAWSRSYSPERNYAAVESIPEAPIQIRITHLVARLFFRGIYFPQMGRSAWLKLLFQNRKAIFKLTGEGISVWRNVRKEQRRAVKLAEAA